MRVFNGFDEIKSAVGTQVGTSDWIEITQDRINKFADATCDATFVSGNSGTLMTLSLCLAGWIAVPQ